MFARHSWRTLCRWATTGEVGPAPQHGENGADQIVTQISISCGVGLVTVRQACHVVGMAHLSASYNKHVRLMPTGLGRASPTEAFSSPPAPLVWAAPSLQNKHTKRAWNCQEEIQVEFVLRAGQGRRKHQSQKVFQSLDIWLHLSLRSTTICQFPSRKKKKEGEQPSL